MGFIDHLFGKKKISKDLRECKEALEKRPSDLNLMKKLGDLYLKSNDPENAAEIYVMLADSYSDRGFYPKATALYKQAQKLLPTWKVAHEKLAELYQMQGFVREAANQYVKLSELMEQEGNEEEAIAFMQKAAELDPALKELNKKVDKFEVKEKAMLEGMPNATHSPQVQGTDFFDLKDELDKEIDMLDIHDTVAMGGSENDDITDVKTVFKAIEDSAMDENANDPLFLYNMGLAYRETGLLDEAIDAFKRVISTGEKLFDSYTMLGVTLRERGLHRDAIETFKKAATLEEASQEMKMGILYEIGQTYKAMGETDRALSIFREIQKEHRDFRDVENEIAKLAGEG